MPWSHDPVNFFPGLAPTLRADSIFSLFQEIDSDILLNVYFKLYVFHIQKYPVYIFKLPFSDPPPLSIYLYIMYLKK